MAALRQGQAGSPPTTCRIGSTIRRAVRKAGGLRSRSQHSSNIRAGPRGVSFDGLAQLRALLLNLGNRKHGASFDSHFALANIGLLLYDKAYLCKCGNIHAVRRADRRAFGAKRHRRKQCAQTYLWRNKATGARRAVQPVRYRLAWPIDSGNPIGAAGFPVSTHEFPVHVEQIPCLARAGNWPAMH